LTGRPIVIYQDGTVVELDPVSGASTVLVYLFGQNAMNQTLPATAVNRHDGLLFVNYNNGFDSGIGFVTLNLSSRQVVYNVPLGTLPYNGDYTPIIFEMNWVPDISSLVVLATGNWDQMFYVDPRTGNTTYAFFELDQIIDDMQFCTVTGTKSDDTYKNNAYDPVAKMLYFQATKGSCADGTTTLLEVGPFQPGPPQTIYWADVALQPLDFGYQGMHYVLCNGTCPT
jgi:hypothetical protein